MVKYEVVERIAVLSEGRGYSKELNLVSWNGAQPKYDLRKWLESESGTIVGRGITLDDAEMAKLVEAVKGRN